MNPPTASIPKKKRNFSELLNKMPPEAQKRARDRATQTLQTMALHELRRARKITQRELAAGMGVAQGEVSKIEQRSEMRLGTLDSYVRALGGTLEIKAVFPEGSIIPLQVTQAN